MYQKKNGETKLYDYRRKLTSYQPLWDKPQTWSQPLSVWDHCNVEPPFLFGFDHTDWDGGILVPGPGIKPELPTLEVWSQPLDHLFFCDWCTDLPRMLPHSFVCFFQNFLFCIGVQPIDWVRFLGRGDPMEKGMATQSSIPPWRIPRMKEPAGAILHRVAKSQTRLSDKHPPPHTHTAD